MSNNNAGHHDSLFVINAPVKIAVIGSGYVGIVAAACFAELGHSVVCVDKDEKKVAALQNRRVPIYEELLPELIEKHSGSSLTFTTDMESAVEWAEAIFIAVGTPSMESGDADLSFVECVATEVANSVNGYKVVVEKSTSPVYTSAWIARVIARNGVAKHDFDVVSNPEFLREGTAIKDFLHPDRIVVGTGSDRAFAMMQRIYRPLTSGTYFDGPSSVPGSCSHESPAKLLRTSAESAELIKHASNAYLAMKLSFVNSVANVCEAVGADISEVADGVGMDKRIGRQFFSAGIGYGGSCFPKDVKAFRAVASQVGVELRLLHEVERINDEQQARFLAKVRSTLWTLKGKRLAVLGLAFKAGTDDVRESPAIRMVRAFLAEGCTVVAHDPAAMANACALFLGDGIRFVDDPYDVANGADALVILTEWPEFAELDFAKIKKRLLYPIVLDGRNLLNPSFMGEQGFTYVSVGRSPQYAEQDPAIKVVDAKLKYGR